jgi:hypothetical protein
MTESNDFKTFLNKMVEIEKEISDEKGPFLFYGLLQNDTFSDRWDFLVSAYWIDKDEIAAIEYISNKLSSTLSRDEIVLISAIYTIVSNNPFLDEIRQSTNVNHGLKLLRNQYFFDHLYPKSYLISTGSSSSNVTIS